MDFHLCSPEPRYTASAMFKAFHRGPRDQPGDSSTSSTFSQDHLHADHPRPANLLLRRGDVVLLRKLGGGAQGSVFAAATTSPHFAAGSPSDVAVKVMRLDASATHERDTHRAICGHDNVAAFYGSFNHFDRLYLTTELLRGGDLRDSLSECDGGMQVLVALDIVRQLAAALRHIHASGVAHCDLKPENVMLAQPFAERTRNVVKLVDFGLAVWFNPSQPGGPLVFVDGGTPVYMSPEALEGRRHDPRSSDMYALGVLLHELVCGSRPFDVDDGGVVDVDALLRARKERVLFKDDVWDSVHGAVKQSVRALLQEDWRMRPSAAEVVDAFDGLPEYWE